MVAGGGDKEASDEVWFELIICATVKSLVTDLPVNNSRKLSPRSGEQMPSPARALN